MAIDRPDFVDGEPVASTEVATVPRDADGKVFRADWSDGPAPPALDPEHVPSGEQSAFTSEEQAEMRGETESPGSFDALDANSQTLFRNQAGLDQAQASVDKVKAHFGDDFAEMDSKFEALPRDAQMTVAALLSHDWTQYGAEALGDALDQLMDKLPLTSEAELREFLVDYGFIEG